MSLDALLTVATERRLTSADVNAFFAAAGPDLPASLDAAARTIARRYAAGSLGYTVADHVMNHLFAAAAERGTIPDFMFSVFQAFDAGEFYPDDIRDPTPEQRFTRPQIQAILAKDAAV